MQGSTASSRWCVERIVESLRGADNRTQLLVIEGLTASGTEDNVDTAEILQNKLYYESETLDMVLTVITTYKTQSMK